MTINNTSQDDSGLIGTISRSGFYGIAHYTPVRNDSNEIVDFRVAYTNKEVPSNFGLAPDQVVGKMCREVYPGIFDNGVFEKMVETISSGNPVTYEVSVTHSGKVAWLSGAVEKMDDGVIVTSRNITHEKETTLHYEKLSAQLAEKNRELSAFTYIASHDLQEPLRKIQMFAGRILEAEGQNFSDRTREYFDKIMSTAGRLQNLTEALLAYSGMDSEDMVFRKTSLDKVLKEALNLIDLAESGATVEKQDLPSIRIIPVQFQQLLFNMINNSIKYARAGVAPKIIVSAEKTIHDSVEYWKISVSDNGIGFDQKFSEKIFDIFYRLHGKLEYSGSGVGLAICKKIAENHGGFMTAEGKPGEGAVFSVFVPANL